MEGNMPFLTGTLQKCNNIEITEIIMNIFYKVLSYPLPLQFYMKYHIGPQMTIMPLICLPTLILG